MVFISELGFYDINYGVCRSAYSLDILVIFLCDNWVVFVFVFVDVVGRDGVGCGVNITRSSHTLVAALITWAHDAVLIRCH